MALLVSAAATVTLAIFVVQARILAGGSGVLVTDTPVNYVGPGDPCDLAQELRADLLGADLRVCSGDDECVLIGGMDGCGDSVSRLHLDEFRALFGRWHELVEDHACDRGAMCKTVRWQEARCVDSICVSVGLRAPPSESELIEQTRRALSETSR
jgi:hypothetical protein